MPEQYAAVDVRIEEALKALRMQSKPNVAKTARDFAVPEQRLRGRWKGGTSRIGHVGAGRKLSEEQELAVCHYLDRLDKVGAAAHRSMVGQCANSLLRQHHDSLTEAPPVVGRNWARRFLSRHPEYSVRKQKSLDVERKNAHDPTALRLWYEGYLKIVTEKGITSTDTYNVDETGFRMGIGRDQWIITRDHSRKAYLASSTTREMMTCVETITGDGGVLPPMFIFSAAQHLEHWFQGDLAEDIVFAVTESGYTNDEITLQWLYHFDRYSAQRQAGTWRLLLLDGYGSHCTLEFVKYCNQHQIIPLCFPPHATHLMQPLDVVVFGPYKHHHSEAIDQATRTGCSDFNKSEFLHSITSIRDRTFKTTTVRSAFRRTGLIPYDPRQVLEHLQEFHQQERLSSESSSGSSPTSTPPPVSLRTPLTIRILQRQGNALRERSLSPSVQVSLNKFVKGSLVQAFAGRQAEEELLEMQSASRARAARQAAHTRRVVQKGGVLTVANARHAIRVREEDELIRAQSALEKAERAVRRKKTKHWNPVWKELKKTTRSRATRMRQQERTAERQRKASQRLLR